MSHPYVISIVLALALAAPATGAAANARPLRHVRVLDSVLAASLRDHLDESPTLQATVDALERSDTIVHVVRGPQPSGIDGSTVFVSAAGGVRYLRVTIGLLISGEMAVSLLGHELQHALEIALDRTVVDLPSLRRLYERLDKGCGLAWTTAYDTRAARDAGRQVALELRRARVAAVEARRRVRHAGFTLSPPDRHDARVR